MQVHKTGLCGSSPHATCGVDCAKAALEMLPWKSQIFDGTGNADEARKQAARQAIVASIDRGIPVQYGSEEDGLIVGYQKNGAEWIALNPMRDWGQKTFVDNQQQWPWGIRVYTERKASAPDRRKQAVESLRKAVQMANTAEDPEKAYYVGFRAWDFFIRTVEALDQADEKARGDAMMGNSWIYECLASYRMTAATYLRQVAEEFPSPAAKHLKRAADLYERMSKEVLQDKDHDVMRIAPVPWLLKPGETWSSAMRKDEVRRLKEALPLERQAIGEIEQALGAM
jgi:hypothetical protein